MPVLSSRQRMAEIRDNFGELQRLRTDEDASKLDVMQVNADLKKM